jgi:hypothetical protein
VHACACGYLGAWAYMHIAFLIQHTTCMHHIVTSFVAPRSPLHFSTLSHKSAKYYISIGQIPIHYTVKYLLQQRILTIISCELCNLRNTWVKRRVSVHEPCSVLWWGPIYTRWHNQLSQHAYTSPKSRLNFTTSDMHHHFYSTPPIISCKLCSPCWVKHVAAMWQCCALFQIIVCRILEWVLWNSVHFLWRSMYLDTHFSWLDTPIYLLVGLIREFI